MMGLGRTKHQLLFWVFEGLSNLVAKLLSPKEFKIFSSVGVEVSQKVSVELIRLGREV